MLKALLLDRAEYCIGFYRETLARRGFTVYLASCAHEAERHWNAHPDTDLIVAEVALANGECGRTVAESLVKRSETASILYVSVYPLEYLVGMGFIPENGLGARTAFLAKPFTASTLATAVCGLMAVS